jgi:hypothetical protein
LITRLEHYADGNTAPVAPVADGRSTRPAIGEDERRRRAAASMRAYRAKVAAAKPQPKPPRRQKRKAASIVQPPADPPVDAPLPVDAPAVEAVAAPPPVVEPSPEELQRKRAARNLRRKIRRAERLGHEITDEQAPNCKFNQAPTSISAWEVDAKTGVRTRILATSGEQPLLKGERAELSSLNGQ